LHRQPFHDHKRIVDDLFVSTQLIEHEKAKGILC
jgi:hypothetical protein